VLLRSDLLRTDDFWREEVAGLEQFNKPTPQLDPPPENKLAGGFSIFGLNSKRVRARGSRGTVSGEDNGRS
jgi:hypothetical protein